VPEGDLIDALKEQDNFLMQKYNDKMQQEKPEKTTSVWQENRPTRAGTSHWQSDRWCLRASA
jgi:hypothetical protein